MHTQAHNIDNSALEMQLVDQLLSDKQLSELVDEFFFEHHVDVEPMRPYWGLDTSLKLEDTYHLFQKLRSLGIIAHAWV